MRCMCCLSTVVIWFYLLIGLNWTVVFGLIHATGFGSKCNCLWFEMQSAFGANAIGI